LEPNFDLSRLVIKVPSTWEGLQACRKLKDLGINTLATTLFTIEQAILAGEVGCISISPFVHELRVHFDES
jgi:transaldolase